ncbi:CHAT domain-containing protein [Amylostereum chailletii]|nr:CHAT domain-containing protein [Amylostereum chailletii]
MSSHKSPLQLDSLTSGSDNESTLSPHKIAFTLSHRNELPFTVLSTILKVPPAGGTLPNHYQDEQKVIGTSTPARLSHGSEVKFSPNRNLQEDIPSRDSLGHTNGASSPRNAADVPASSSLDNLAVVIWLYFEQHGFLLSFDEVTGFHEEALSRRAPEYPDRLFSLANLTHALRLPRLQPTEPDVAFKDDNPLNVSLRRFREFRKAEYLDDAIGQQQRALLHDRLCNNEHPTSLDQLSALLWARYLQRGKAQDLEETIEACREAVNSRQSNAPDRGVALDNLAITLTAQFVLRDESDDELVWSDLQEGIQLHREAQAFYPRGHLFRPLSLDRLGGALIARFNHPRGSGINDLEEAIHLFREGLSLCPNYPERGVAVDSLASSLRMRFREADRIEDLTEAIQLLRNDLPVRSRGHRDRLPWLKAVVQNTMTLYSRRGQVENLDEAINLYREMASLYLPNEENQESTLQGLGSTILMRFERRGQMFILLESIIHDKEADLIDSGGDQAIIASVLLCLGLEAFQRRRMALASICFQRASASPNGSSGNRFLAALKWAEAERALGHGPAALRAYRRALDLVQRCILDRATIEHKREYLIRPNVRSLPPHAASLAIEMGEVEAAVEIFEQGRGLLWSQMREYRHPLDDLKASHPDFAETFESVSLRLEQLAAASIRPSTRLDTPINPGVLRSTVVGVFSEHSARQQNALSKEWDAIVAKIQALDGFHGFLRTKSFDTLRAAASEGPVLIVHVSEIRSDIIILTKDGHPVSIPLPVDLPAVLGRLARTVTLIHQHVRGSAPAFSQGSTSKAMRHVLGVLWTNIAKPAVNALHDMGIAKGSRIWLCPTGTLVSLPLHAAGTYDADNLDIEDNLPDNFVVSYTPTLASLIEARRGQINTSVTCETHWLLAVGQSRALPQVSSEFRCIADLFTDRARIVDNTAATPAMVLSALRDSPMVHFACHGSLDVFRPFESSFVLHGGTLSILQVAQARLQHAELAFLASCHSAAGDTQRTPEEGLSLSGAMQFCGYRSVVGTLWTMADVDGPSLARGFYSRLLPRSTEDRAMFGRAAEALHGAVQEMRHDGVPLERWRTFIHTGA